MRFISQSWACGIYYAPSDGTHTFIVFNGLKIMWYMAYGECIRAALTCKWPTFEIEELWPLHNTFSLDCFQPYTSFDVVLFGIGHFGNKWMMLRLFTDLTNIKLYKLSPKWVFINCKWILQSLKMTVQILDQIPCVSVIRIQNLREYFFDHTMNQIQ